MRLSFPTLVIIFALGGCEQDLLAGLPDAEVDAPVQIVCPSPTPALAPGNFTLYLNTEGVTLTKCSPDNDDARVNCASVIAVDTAVIPSFLPDRGDREAIICEIVATAQGGPGAVLDRYRDDAPSLGRLRDGRPGWRPVDRRCRSRR